MSESPDAEIGKALGIVAAGPAILIAGFVWLFGHLIGGVLDPSK